MIPKFIPGDLLNHGTDTSGFYSIVVVRVDRESYETVIIRPEMVTYTSHCSNIDSDWEKVGEINPLYISMFTPSKL